MKAYADNQIHKADVCKQVRREATVEFDEPDASLIPVLKGDSPLVAGPFRNPKHRGSVDAQKLARF